MRLQRILAAGIAAALIACSGSRGPAGKDGADGKDGAQGAKGDTGATGKNGADGKNGTDGKDGAPGKDGANGADGAMGAMGAMGDTGANGTDGANGAPGTPGADGKDGNNIILSEKARLGLSLSEVPVDLAGLDGDAVESVGRGAYLVNAVADCKGCHNGTGPQGQTLFLAGNVDFPIGPFDPNNPGPCTPGVGTCVDGHVFTRNLTPDTATGLKLSEEQFVEALRTGRDFKDANGQTRLIVMPWQQLRWMTEQDLRDIYHYIKHIPAVENSVNPDQKPTIPPEPFSDTFGDGDVERELPKGLDLMTGMETVLAGEKYDDDNVLRGLAISPLNDDAIVKNDLSLEDQTLYGRGSYIVNGPGLCNECHTPGGRNRDGTVKTEIFLSGGQSFAVPPPLQPMLHQVRTMSANLTGAAHGFTLDFPKFIETWVSGTSFTMSSPHALGFPMPFDTFRNMTTTDKQAVYTYITTIQKNHLITGDSPHQAPARYCTSATVATDCRTGETCASVTIGAPTGECVGGSADCTADSDCGACETCDLGGSNPTKRCIAEDPNSDCVKNSF